MGAPASRTLLRPTKDFAAAMVYVYRSRDKQETAEEQDATAATAGLRPALPSGSFPRHARTAQVLNRVQESGMKTPSGGWRHTSEEDWLLSLALVAFTGNLPSGMPFFSHEEDSKVLEQCLRLREVQALGTAAELSRQASGPLACAGGGQGSGAPHLRHGRP